MAVPFDNVAPLSQSEQEAILLAKSFKQMAETPAWKGVLSFLDTLVENAQEELLGNYKDPAKDAALASRWRQRETIKRALIQLVDSHGQEYDELMKQLTTPEDDDDADDNA